MAVRETIKRQVQKFDQLVPEQVPPLSRYPLAIFNLIWSLGLIAAILFPIVGLYLQFSGATSVSSYPSAYLTPGNSSQLLGSSIGLALDESDATAILAPVGDVVRRAGVHPGDKLVAVDGHLIGTKPSSEILASDNAAVRLTVRTASRELKSLSVVRGENHFNSEARRQGIPPWILMLVREAYIVFFPLLLWMAIALHFRNRGHVVPELLSISFLLFACATTPGNLLFFASGVPTSVSKLLGRLLVANFIAVLLLFPDARLRPRTIPIALLMLPLIILDPNATVALWALAALLGFAVLALPRRVRRASGVARQQLKVLLIGLGAVLALFVIAVVVKMLTPSLPSIEGALIFAATINIVTYGGIFVIPWLLLFAGVRRHRLYDAEELFSRSAIAAVLTIGIALFFAATSRILDITTQGLFHGAAAWSSIIAAAAAVFLLKPAQRRLQDWTERHFQKHLFELRNELPQRMDDLRETATAATLLKVALGYVVRALRVDAAAAVFDKQLIAAVGVQQGHARRWLHGQNLVSDEKVICDRNDPMFPVRLPLRPGTECSTVRGWIFVGRRPDGSIISRDERKALREVDETIARAVDVARERERLNASERRWRKQQEARLRTLERSVETLITAISQSKEEASS